MGNSILFKISDYIEPDLKWEKEECAKVGVELTAYQLKYASPSEIIAHCAHPRYREPLQAYLKKAESTKSYRPILLDEAFQFHRNFETKGTMLG